MHVFNDFCYNVMQLSDPQPQLTNRKAPKVLKEGPNRKEEEEEDGVLRHRYMLCAKLTNRVDLEYHTRCYYF